MRKVIFGGAVSLDNRLDGPDEALDWLRWSEDAQAIGVASFEGVDTILFGRKTFEVAVKSGGGAASPSIKSYVFSSSLASAPEGVELVRGDPAAFVRKLKAQTGGNIIVMGGGLLGAALLDGGAVDEIGLNIHPLLLGGGTPLFHEMGRRVELELIEVRPLAKECVLLRYRVTN